MAYNNLASLLRGHAQHGQEALRLFTVAYELEPHVYYRHPQMHLNLAGVLVDAGRYDEAIWHYEGGLPYKPNYEDTVSYTHLTLPTICSV